MTEVDFKKVVLTLPKSLNFPGLKLGRWKMEGPKEDFPGCRLGRWKV